MFSYCGLLRTIAPRTLSVTDAPALDALISAWADSTQQSQVMETGFADGARGDGACEVGSPRHRLKVTWVDATAMQT